MLTSSLQASTSLSLNPPLIFRQLNIMKKKVILKIELVDDSIKRKVMRGVSRLPGVESVSVDMKGKKLTLTGDVDPESIVGKLRKLCRTEIVSVEEEKEDKKKEKKEEKKEDEKDLLADLVKDYQNYYRNPNYASSVEEDPKACVIC